MTNYYNSLTLAKGACEQNSAIWLLNYSLVIQEFYNYTFKIFKKKHKNLQILALGNFKHMSIGYYILVWMTKYCDCSKYGFLDLRYPITWTGLTSPLCQASPLTIIMSYKFWVSITWPPGLPILLMSCLSQPS
jgi:hypothetical protein